MKTDAQLQQDVMAELRWDPALHAAQIGVDVKDGVVTLASARTVRLLPGSSPAVGAGCGPGSARCAPGPGPHDARELSPAWAAHRKTTMNLGTLLFIALILLLVGAFPTWPHSRSWGYMPSGAVGLLLVIVIVLLLLGRL